MDKEKKNIWLVFLGGTTGNITEWYNVLLYGYLASIMSELFFPTKTKLLSLMLVYTVFAATFFMRPLGGIIFGRIGDLYGRRPALVFSTSLMAFSSLVITFLPTYNMIGSVAPLLLSLFRMLQGLSTGGEHTGSGIYIAEHAPPKRYSLWISFVPTSAAIGLLFSSSVSLFLVKSLSHDALLLWGWRAGFFLGALLSIMSFFLRLKMPESPYFQKAHKEQLHKNYPLRTLIKDPNLLIIFSLASTWGVFYQILYVWLPVYLSTVIHLPYSLSLKINTFFLFMFASLIILAGYLADYINRKHLLTVSCLLMLTLAYPFFIFLASGVIWKIYTAMTIFSLVFSFFISTAFITMIEAFPIYQRYTSLSLGFNTGLAIFGSTCPLVVTWLIQITQNNVSPAYYMILAAITALFTCTKIKSQAVTLEKIPFQT